MPTGVVGNFLSFLVSLLVNFVSNVNSETLSDVHELAYREKFTLPKKGQGSSFTS